MGSSVRLCLSQTFKQPFPHPPNQKKKKEKKRKNLTFAGAFNLVAGGGRNIRSDGCKASINNNIMHSVNVQCQVCSVFELI